MPRRNKVYAVDERRATVARLYCEGLTQATIAGIVDVSQQQVSLDLVAIREEWKRQQAEQFDTYKVEQLAKIDATESAAWRGWRRSLRDAVKRRVKSVAAGPEEQ